MRAPIVLNGSLMICMQSDQRESSTDNVAHCHAVSRGGFAWWLVGGEFNPKEVYQTSLRGRGASFAYPQDVYRAASEFVSNDSWSGKNCLLADSLPSNPEVLHRLTIPYQCSLARGPHIPYVRYIRPRWTKFPSPVL